MLSDETTEDDIQEEIKEEDITPPEEKEEEQEGGDDEKKEEQENVTIDEQLPTSDNTEVESSPSTLSFNDVDTAVDTDKNEYNINAPKDVEIEEISKYSK